MMFYRVLAKSTQREKTDEPHNWYVCLRKLRTSAFLVALAVMVTVGLRFNFPSVLAGGIVLGCFLLGWLLGERSVVNRYMGIIRFPPRLSRWMRKKEGPLHAISKGEIARLRSLLRIGKTFKGQRIMSYGLFLAMAVEEWFTDVNEAVEEICGKESVEYLLVSTARNSPYFSELAFREAEDLGVRDILGMLVDVHSTLASLITNGLPVLARMPDKLRDIEINAVMEATRIIIGRLRKGYGPIEIPQ